MDNLRKIVIDLIALEEQKENMNIERIKKYYLIKELLKDDKCFFKISMNDACNILDNLGVEDPREYYKTLICAENFNIVNKKIDLVNIFENSN